MCNEGRVVAVRVYAKAESQRLKQVKGALVCTSSISSLVVLSKRRQEKKKLKMWRKKGGEGADSIMSELQVAEVQSG